jgi:hypothetical protein
MDAIETDIEKENKKAKLIYSGELILFAIVFLVLGILVSLKIISLSERWRRIFTWVTLLGGAYGLFDFFWAVFSKKHRKKVSLLDKILMLPIPCALIPIDILSLFQNYGLDYAFYQWTLVGLFFYITIIYTVEGIYHWYVPVPGLLEDEPKKKEGKEEPEDVLEKTEEEKKDGEKDGK